MKPDSAANRWEMLQARAHLPKVQEIIRGEIYRGTIRVVPAPGGGIQIMPTNEVSPLEDNETSHNGRLDIEQRMVPVLRIERRTQ
jgi:hypothetical protein